MDEKRNNVPMMMSNFARLKDECQLHAVFALSFLY